MGKLDRTEMAENRIGEWVRWVVSGRRFGLLIFAMAFLLGIANDPETWCLIFYAGAWRISVPHRTKTSMCFWCSPGDALCFHRGSLSKRDHVSPGSPTPPAAEAAGGRRCRR